MKRGDKSRLNDRNASRRENDKRCTESLRLLTAQSAAEEDKELAASENERRLARCADDLGLMSADRGVFSWKKPPERLFINWLALRVRLALFLALHEQQNVLYYCLMQ